MKPLFASVIDHGTELHPLVDKGGEHLQEAIDHLAGESRPTAPSG